MLHRNYAAPAKGRLFRCLAQFIVVIISDCIYNIVILTYSQLDNGAPVCPKTSQVLFYLANGDFAAVTRSHFYFAKEETTP